MAEVHSESWSHLAGSVRFTSATDEVFHGSVRLAGCGGVVSTGLSGDQDVPKEERFGLAAQTRRAAISVSSNIAEGKGRSTLREFCRFLDIALGSAFEVHSQLEVAHALGMIDSEEVQAIVPLIRKIHRSITKLKQVVGD